MTTVTFWRISYVWKYVSAALGLPFEGANGDSDVYSEASNIEWAGDPVHLPARLISVPAQAVIGVWVNSNGFISEEPIAASQPKFLKTPQGNLELGRTLHLTSITAFKPPKEVWGNVVLDLLEILVCMGASYTSTTYSPIQQICSKNWTGAKSEALENYLSIALKRRWICLRRSPFQKLHVAHWLQELVAS